MLSEKHSPIVFNPEPTPAFIVVKEPKDLKKIHGICKIVFAVITFHQDACKKKCKTLSVVSRLVFFANTPPKHDISVYLHRILFRTLAK
jgi:hypothetical protein